LAPELGRPTQEEECAVPIAHGALECFGLGELPAQAESPFAFAERFENPEPEVVHEPDQRQPELLEQEVEAQEVEKRERPHHVDDHALARSVSNASAPVFID
jgi:hypothetical protein